MIIHPNYHFNSVLAAVPHSPACTSPSSDPAAGFWDLMFLLEDSTNLQRAERDEKIAAVDTESVHTRRAAIGGYGDSSKMLQWKEREEIDSVHVMESVVGFSSSIPTHLPKLRRSSTRMIPPCLKSQLKVENGADILLQSAIDKATLRHQETLRPVPLFMDPYAACFLPSKGETDVEHGQHPYCLATKFVDDWLVETLKNNDGIKQIVLLTDGMDTRPYRISWPISTVIYDVSPDTTFKASAQKLEEVGAKVSKSCLLLHIPLEPGNLQLKLRGRGFNGNRLSVWVIQGLPVTKLDQFENILLDVDVLAMEGCLVLGELPGQVAETESDDAKSWLERILLRHGFRLLYAEVTDTSGMESVLPCYKSVLFVAQHLRLSDDQMELWRNEFQRIEDDGDEEGFEEL